MLEEALASDLRDKPSNGRPRGAISAAILKELNRAGPLTARELAARLQVTVNVAEFTCSRLYSRGEIDVAARVRVSWSNRRVSQYSVVKHGSGQAAMRLPATFFVGAQHE